MRSFKIGSFNVLNLQLPNQPMYADSKPYSQDEFEQKVDWIAGQLRCMRAHVVGFQEVWHRDALLRAVMRSGSFNVATVEAPEADGSRPGIGLATTLPLAEPVQVISDFPAGIDKVVDGLGLPIRKFSRSVLKAKIRLLEDPAAGRDGSADAGAGAPVVTVFVAHLKSKRAIVDPEAPRFDLREEALGQARALIVRAAEATALRMLVLDEIVGNRKPVVVVGDLNDDELAVTNEIIQGVRPTRHYPKAREAREKVWDGLLYSAIEIALERSRKNIDFTNIYAGRYSTLDHVLVSEEFYERNPERIGTLVDVRYFNDHLIDSQLSNERGDRVHSDHGQVVAEIALRTQS